MNAWTNQSLRLCNTTGLTEGGLRVPGTFFMNTMAKDNKISMPSGMGGLVRYFDGDVSRLSIKPGHVIVLSFFVVIIMILLYTYGNQLLGV